MGGLMPPAIFVATARLGLRPRLPDPHGLYQAGHRPRLDDHVVCPTVLTVSPFCHGMLGPSPRLYDHVVCYSGGAQPFLPLPVVFKEVLSLYCHFSWF